jgi:hypothetical protein
MDWWITGLMVRGFHKKKPFSSNTSFRMRKMLTGKETVKFLAKRHRHELPITNYRLSVADPNCCLRMASEFRLMTPLSGEGLKPKGRESKTRNA